MEVNTPKLESLAGRGGLMRVTMDAVIIRADGTREDLGTVGYWHRNPIKRWGWNARDRWRRWQAARRG